MLQATVKLCCGIAHDHLRRLPGLKLAAVAAMQNDVRGLVLRGSRRLPSKLPRYIQRLMGKDAAACPEPDGDLSSGRFSSVDLSYVSQGERALQRALGILQQHDGWQAETVPDAGAAVSSAALPGLGRVFRAEAVLGAPVARLHRELFEDVERMPEWYPALGRVEVLRRVGPDTLLTHEVTARGPGDLAGPRDFVSVRHRRSAPAAVYLVGTAAGGRPPPPPPGCVRAESRLSCVVLRPLPGDPGRTRFTWLLCMDLKGWIPASVLHRVLPRSQADFIGRLRQRLARP
ncbi:steroidogenic acute regulatory protein, mitochondrial-like [Dromaius novaehollandiae]|uniref:steroidogenic acute regulatory protein, mitochondrial-like n=1 Tax=Dromaius novaehollandiae TaxID=8790 RepID=UPI00311DCE94